MLKTELCRYRYDPLDQLIGREPAGQEKLQHFYRHKDLTTVLRGQASQSVFQHDKQLLALQSCQDDVLNSELLTTDQQRSVLQVTGPGGAERQVYTAYGHRWAESGPGSLLGFNGEAVDRVTGHYLLGNGRRAFNPVLMRFHSPDRLSPFGRGGWNAYAYCQGDPVNFCDPTGQFLDSALRLFISSNTFLSSVLAFKPAIPFKLANSALAQGAVFNLPPKLAFGAASSAVGTFMGAGFGVTSLASAIVFAIDRESPALLPLTIISAVFMAGAAAGRVGSGWVARDSKNIPALKSFVERHKPVVATGETPPVSPLSQNMVGSTPSGDGAARASFVFPDSAQTINTSGRNLKTSAQKIRRSSI
jgi:RHS repeat-associated protein